MYFIDEHHFLRWSSLCVPYIKKLFSQSLLKESHDFVRYAYLSKCNVIMEFCCYLLTFRFKRFTLDVPIKKLMYRSSLDWWRSLVFSRAIKGLYRRTFRTKSSCYPINTWNNIFIYTVLWTFSPKYIFGYRRRFDIYQMTLQQTRLTWHWSLWAPRFIHKAKVGRNFYLRPDYGPIHHTHVSGHNLTKRDNRGNTNRLD